MSTAPRTAPSSIAAVTYELGRALLVSETLAPEALAAALHVAVAERVSLLRALLTLRSVDPGTLEAELSRAEAPVERVFTPDARLVAELPEGLCQRLLALPVRQDAATGTVDVVVADARDLHAAEEIAYLLQVPVRVLRAPLAAIEAALDAMANVSRAAPARARSLAAPMGTPPPPPMSPFAAAPSFGAMRVAAPVAPREPTARSAGEAAGEGPSRDREDDDAGDAEDTDDIPIPLSRRASSLPPEVIAPRIADEDRVTEHDPEDEGPVVELRRPRTPPADTATTIATTAANAILREMARVDGRDALLELVLLGARTVTRKAMIFVVKKEGYVGWMCTSELADRAVLQAITIDPRVSTFLSAAATAGRYVGPVLLNDAHQPLLRLLRSPAPEIAAVALRVSGRAAAILVVHEVVDPVAALPRLDEIARAAGEALARIVRKNRPSSAPAHGP
jgi:hypothetical protein